MRVGQPGLLLTGPLGGACASFGIDAEAERTDRQRTCCSSSSYLKEEHVGGVRKVATQGAR